MSIVFLEEVGVPSCNNCGRAVEHGDKCIRCISFIEKIETPEEGGIFMYATGDLRPTKGLPDRRTAEKLNIIKRLVISSTRLFLSKPFIILTIIFLLLPNFIKRFYLKRIIKTLSEVIEATFRQAWSDGKFSYPNPNKLCKSVREIHRTLIAISAFNPDNVDEYFHLAMAACVILEWDNAYRFRIQDILGELNKRNLSTNFKKEILRLLNLMKDREITAKIKIYPLIRALKIILFFWPDINNFLFSFLKEIDQEKVKFDEDDKYAVWSRVDYNFAGKNFLERKAEFDEMTKEIPKVGTKKIKLAIEKFNNAQNEQELNYWAGQIHGWMNELVYRKQAKWILAEKWIVENKSPLIYFPNIYLPNIEDNFDDNFDWVIIKTKFPFQVPYMEDNYNVGFFPAVKSEWWRTSGPNNREARH